MITKCYLHRCLVYC